MTNPNDKLEPIYPFPKLNPPLAMYKYDGEKDGYWFASICSAHFRLDPDCPRCEVGHYSPLNADGSIP